MKKRFLAMLLALVMVMGLLPTSALAAISSSDASTANSYSVTFAKDAFNMTAIKVVPVDGSTTPVRLKSTITSEVTLEGATFSVGSGSVTIADLLSGYGLLDIQTNRQTPRYYYQYASWGLTGETITSITYQDVLDHGADGLFIHYRVPQNAQFTAIAVNESGSEITRKTTMESTAITDAVAQKLLSDQSISQPYYFDHAELRYKAGGIDAVPIDSIDFINGYYYVTTSLTDSGRTAFNSSEWDVYFVYETAVTLTLNVAYDGDAGRYNQINGVYMDAGAHTYQIPKSGTREFTIKIGTGATAKIVKNNGTELFSSKEDGYEIKEYLLSVKGADGNQTINVTFSANSSQYKLDYTHYTTNQDNYHGQALKLINGSTGASKTLPIKTNDPTTNIANGYRLRIEAGRGTGDESQSSFVPNAVVINGNWVALPWVGVDFNKNPTGNIDITTPMVTDIYDSDGERQATVSVTAYIRRTGNDIGGTTEDPTRYILTFTNIKNHLKITFINLTATSSNDARVTQIDEGLSLIRDNTVQEIGRGLTNVNHTLQPDFGYYVDGFYIATPSQGTGKVTWESVTNEFEPTADTGTNWWGNKVYNLAEGGTNWNKVTSFQQVAAISGLIQYSFAYHRNATAGSAAFYDNQTFTLGKTEAQITTPAIAEGMEPQAPTGKTFVGWSLYPEGQQAGKTVYFAGDVIPYINLKEANDQMTHLSQEGKAYCNLYPVFQDETTGTYATYTVNIHFGETSSSYTYTTGLYGATLDRDNILALPEVAAYVSTLSNVVLDGASSDSTVKLERRSGNEFHLYYNSTQPVTITFKSKYGFNGESGNTVTGTQKPGDVMNVPTPAAAGDAKFLGWSTLSQDDMVGYTDLENALVPYQSTTYYAVYANNVTVRLYTYKLDGTGWRDPQTYTLTYGQNLNDVGAATYVNDEVNKNSVGRTFTGSWLQDSPYSSKTLPPAELLAKTDFAVDTDFYAQYTPATNMSVILNPNGGTWPDETGTGNKTVENLTYGYTFTPGSVPEDAGFEDPGIPNAPDGKMFVGWSTSPTSTLGSPSVSALGWVQTINGTVGGHDLTYHAIWASTTLEVSVNNASSIVYNGQEQKPALTVRKNGQVVSYSENQVQWYNNINAGTASLIVTVDGMKGYATFEIQKANIGSTSDFGVALDGTSYPYTGSQITPTVTVTDKRSGVANTTLTAGVDYQISYGDNVNVGSNGSFRVTGIGNYSGYQDGVFTITGNTTAQLKVAPMPDYLYNGGNQPTDFGLVVQDVTNNRVLKADTDYTLQTPATGNWTIGEHTITVNPTGNYAGHASIQVQCNIVGAATRLDVTADPVLIQGSAGTPTITVKAAGSESNLDSGMYTLSYQRFDDNRNELVPAENLSALGMYVITATGNNNTAYEGAVGVTNFARLAISSEGGLTVGVQEGATTVFNYDGKNHWDALKSKLKVTTSGGETVSTYTYTVASTSTGEDAPAQGSGSNSSPATFDMTKAGSYIIKVIGTGDYSGTGTLYVYVTPKDIGSGDISVTSNSENGFTAVYTGEAHEHPFTITDTTTGKVLVRDTDFTLDDPNHDNHKDVGVYPVTIRGTGNYTGSNSFTFTITPKTLNISKSLTLTYGYDSNAASTALEELENSVADQIVGQDAVTVTLSVDSGLAANTHTGAIRGVLTGDKAANYKLNITSKVTVNPFDISTLIDPNAIQVAPETGIFDNQAHHPAVIISAAYTLKAGTDYDLYYYRSSEYNPGNSNYGTGNLGADGMVTADTYTILAVGKGNYTGKLTGSYTIHPANYNDIIVTIDPAAQEKIYTGQPITLGDGEITVAYGSGTPLESGNYTVSYLNNTNAGTATVTVTEKGTNKTGSATFKILPKDISDTKTISVSAIDDQTYDGTAKTPEPTITYTPSGGTGNTLKKGTDFYLTYQNNVQAGTATVVINGSGNYSGTRNVTFKINYAPATLSFYTWSADGGWSTDTANDITINYGSTITEGNATTIQGLQKEISGYTFAGWAKNSPLETPISLNSLKQENSFSTNTAFYAIYTPKQVTVTLDANGGTVSKETYTAAYGTVLKETATYAGHTFAGWSTQQSGVTVGDMSITVPATDTTYYAVWLQPSLNISVSGSSSFVYNGSQQRPTITVTTSSGETLDSGKYTVDWSGDGINAGTYGFTVTANEGGDTGFGTYTIAPKSITGADTVTIDSIGNVNYSGSEARPTVTISDSETSKELVLNKDFTVGYSNNTGVGQATVTISGIGNYTSTTTKNFTINGYAGNLFIASIPDQIYTGSEITIADLVVYDNNGNIVPSDAYEAVYSNNTAIGTATVTVAGNGTGNYASGASGTANFQIVGSSTDGSKLTVTVTPAQAPVNGDNPTITVKMGESSLTEGNYSLSYEVYSNGSWGASNPLTNVASQLANAGMYRITATGTGNYTGTSGSAIFVRTPADTSTDGGTGKFTIGGLASRVLPYNGTDQMSVVNNMTVTAGEGKPLGKGTDYTVSVSYNGSTVNEMKNAGAYTVLIQGKGNYAQSSASTTIYIQPRDITAEGVTVSGLETATVGYTGAVQKPTVTLKDTVYAGIQANTDYTVSYGSGDYTDAGTYTVTITGKGNYTGTWTATYTITPKELTVSGNVTLTYGYTTVDLSAQESQAATGVESGDNVVVNLYVEPGLAVNAGGHEGALKGYLSGADAQNYTLTIIGKVIVNEATITPPEGGGDPDPNNRFEMIVSPESGSFTGQAHTPTIIVMHNNQVLTLNENYTLSYTKSGGTDVTSTGMVDVGVYTITATGKDSYSGTITGTYEITSSTGGGSVGGLTVDLAEGESGTYTYTGNAITPGVKVTFNGTELSAENYSVDYSFNTNVGQGVITVTGLGNNYQGMSATLTFTISPKNIAGAGVTVDNISNQIYTGSAIEPKPVVTDTGRTGSTGVALVQGVDYYLSYSDNVLAGSAKVTINGMGNYTGTIQKSFTIDSASIGGGGTEPGAGISVAVYPSTGVFTGLPHHPDVVVTHGGMKLVEGENYTLTYQNAEGANVGANGMTDVGTYTIVVKGTGNYSGSFNAKYIITPASGGGSGTGGGSTLTIDSIADQTYTGSAIQPSVTVKYNGQAVGADQYDVTYSANTNVGQATVIVTGKTGTSYENMVGTANFTINPKSIAGSDISVAEIAGQTYTGSAITPEPTITDTTRNTALIQNADYTLSYAGNVNVGENTATITITGRGNYTGMKTVNFTIVAADVGGGDGGDPTIPGTGFTMDVYPASGPYTAEKHNPVVAIHYNGQLLEEGTDYDLSYTKTDGDTDVTDTGMVDVGTYTITATGKGNYAGTVTAPYTITSADASKVLVIKDIADVAYTGSEVQPNIVVTYNSKTLNEGQDYEVSYTGDLTNVGLVAVTVTGKGTYNGLSATAAFQITRKAINSSDITVGDIGNQIYTGGYITPAMTITDGASKLLQLNQDYAVEYSANLNKGTADVTIYGIGNYTGSRTTSFEIVGADVGGSTSGITVNMYPTSGVFNGVAHSPAIIVTHGTTQLVLGRDYTVSGNTNMIQVGEYPITVTGTRNYTGSKTVTYTITSVDGGSVLTIGDIEAVTYNGSEQTPEITVTHNGTPLEEGTDYEVTYSNNTDAGLAVVTVTGKGSYVNMTGTKNFTIQPKNIEQNMVDSIPDQIYTGSAIRPAVTVTDAERDVELALNTDYTVSYGDNVSGTGTVTISGINNYTGTVELSFTITASNTIEVSGINDSYTYTGALIKPDFTVTDGTGRTLVKDVDYTVSYKDNLNVGTATVTVTGLGVYAGQTKVVTFQITAKLLYMDVTVNPPTAIYGQDIHPTISVTLDGTELREGNDYTLSYQMYNNEGKLVDVVVDNAEAAARSVTAADLTAKGMYVITATGTGEYMGAMGSATFVRLPDGGSLTPSGGGLVEGSNVITRTYDHVDYRSVLDGIEIKNTNGETVTADTITVSYNGGEAKSLAESEITEAGVYTVTYDASAKGTAYVVVVINPKNINDLAIDVTGLADDQYTYNATSQSPTVEIADNVVYDLEKDTDYTIVEGDIAKTDAGTYPVTITGTGNYTGYRFENFIINQKPITVAGTENKIEYTYGYQGTYTLTQDTDYTVIGIEDTDQADVTVTVTVPAGLNAGTHTIPAQLSGNKAQNYTVEGGVEITVKPIETGGGDGNTNTDEDGDGVIETTNGFTVTMTPTSGTFTGQAHNPAITVIYAPEGGEQVTLVQNKDYTVTYLDSTGKVVADMIQVGTYTVRIEAIGNYSGSFDLTYTITQGDGGEGGGDGDGDGDGNYEDGNGDHVIEVGGFRVSMTPYSGYFNGQSHNPKVTVTFTNGDSTVTLIENVDFTIAYYDSTGNTLVNEMSAVGVYTVRVIGIGNYNGNNFDLAYTILNTPSGGGGGGGGGTTEPEPEDPGDSGNNSGVATPDQTGVSNWLVTSDHIAYMSGYPGNLFAPNNSMTRAEAAQLFYNLLLNKDVSITVSFKDVAGDAWYAKAVKTLASLGIIKGVSADTFDPQRSITRAEFAAIAMRFTSMESTGESIFMDVSPDDWFYESVVGATQFGWIQGYPDGTFGPNNTVSRAEVTTIVNRMLGRSADKNYVNNNQDTLVQFNDVVSGHWAYYQIMEATNAHNYTMSGNNETWTELK